MAIVDYDYKFLYMDVGCQGRISDGGVFRNTEFYCMLSNDELNLPKPCHLSGNENMEKENVLIPYHFVADEAFTLSEFCMKPFSQNKLTLSSHIRKRIWNLD